MDDTPCAPTIEHDAPGHLRRDGDGAVDAERGAPVVGAHVADQLVSARCQNDPVDCRIVEGRHEFHR